MIEVKRALLSCWDKTGLAEFAQTLLKYSIEIVSSGGTAAFLEESGIPVIRVEEITGSPEILGGRVKTLHPNIHAAILATGSPEHQKELAKLNIKPIQLVVVNLYPFIDEAVQKQLTLDKAIEYIDIGGPTMLRAAAKNFQQVAVLHDPAQYASFMTAFEAQQGGVTPDDSEMLARKTFFYTSWYDGQIQAYFQNAGSSESEKELSDLRTLHLEKGQVLRYGENPHQQGAVYYPFKDDNWGMAGVEQLWGKPLSFNNYTDVKSAYELALELPEKAVAIIKHSNPCGAASSRDRLAAAFNKALSGDPLSAFGGVVACNQVVDLETAELMAKIFFECVIAPDFQHEALMILQKKKKLRILKLDPDKCLRDRTELKSINGAFLAQTVDRISESGEDWQVVTQKAPTAEQLKDLGFAWKLVKHIKSNAIVLTKDFEIYGVGAGQMSRVDAVKLAQMKALQGNRELNDIILGSDAFFPFRDGVDQAVEAGVTAIIQPGGSIRDQEVIDAANEHHICMVFTGIRHFKH